MPPLCPLCLLEQAHHDCPANWPCLYCFIGLHHYCDPIRFWCSCDCTLKGNQ